MQNGRSASFARWLRVPGSHVPSSGQPRRAPSIVDTPAEADVIFDAREAVLLDDVDRSSDVFISHASADNDIATKLFQALDARGVSVWVDLARLQLGFSLARQIDQGIAKCRLGLVLITPTFLTGRFWTDKELGAIMTSRKHVIPIIHGVSRRVLEVDRPDLQSFDVRVEPAQEGVLPLGVAGLDELEQHRGVVIHGMEYRVRRRARQSSQGSVLGAGGG